MEPKDNSAVIKNCEECKKKSCDESDCWSPEKMLDVLMRNQHHNETQWVEKGVRNLVDKILVNYDAFGGMEHLEGKDLPSKKVVIEVLEDLFTVLFPGYLGETDISKTSIKYHLAAK